MPLISTSFPNLTGGVSQQPSSQRLPNQCEEQENALPLIVGGLIKRPPTNHVAELVQHGGGASVDLSDAFTHLIQRDADERFIVSIKPNTGGIFVHDLDGTARQVYTGEVASGYLESATPKTAFKAITIADVTFLLNTEKTATLKTAATDLSPKSRGQGTTPRDALIWVKNTGQGVKFEASFTAEGQTAEVVTVKHTPAPEAIDNAQTVDGLTVWYDGSDATATIQVTAGSIVLVNGSTTTTLILSDSNHDTLGELVDHINSSSVHQWYAVLNGSSNAGTGNLVTQSATNAKGIGAANHLKLATEADAFAYPPNAPGTSEIATALASGVEPTNTAVTYSGTVSSGGLNGIADVTATSQGSVVWISSAIDSNSDGVLNDFQLDVDDSFGQSAIQIVKDEVQDFGDLPPVAPNGMIVLVRGDPESEVDDYYVKFETNGGGTFGEGLWFETIGPDLVYQYDYDTMPHILVRQPDNTFMFKKADGQTPATGAHADLASKWADFKYVPRQTGSDLTNPLPSFHQRKITGMTFFKNRLGLVSGEDVILSEAAELFNFFRTTTTQLLDTAPIDVGVGGTEINQLKTAIPFSDRLLLFSERAQFVLQGEAILSPLTASISRATNFDVTTGVDPVPAGNTLFFAFNRGAFSGIREFYKTNETDINFDAVESTSQAPKYIAGTVKKMTVSTMEDLLAVQSATSNTIWMYKYFKTDQGRLQSAWFKFTFGGAEVIDINFVQQSLYIMIKRGTRTYLERMDLQTGLVDTGSTYTTLLDRRVKITTGGSGFTLNLPSDYRKEAGETFQVVAADGEVMTIDSETTTSITLEEEFTSGAVFWVGVPYTMKYEMTEPVLKRPKQGGGYEMIATGRHQIRYMTVVYDDTAYFKVKITPDQGGSDGETIEYPFSGKFLSTGGLLGYVPASSGDYRFPVFTQSDGVRIEIENDSPFPSNIQSVEFEAQYTSRSQRTQ